MSKPTEWFSTLRSTSGLSQYPTSPIEHIQFLDFFADQTDLTKVTTVTESAVIPASGNVRVLGYLLDYAVTGNLTVVRADTTAYTPIEWTLTPTSLQVAVEVGGSHLRFNPDQVGQVATIVYKTPGSRWDSAALAYLWSEVVEIAAVGGGTGTAATVTAVAGEAIDKQFVYVGIDGRVYVADPAKDTPPQYYCVGPFAEDDSATCYEWGEVAVDISLPYSVRIYCGKNGKPTWSADTTTNKLTTGDFRTFVGYRIGIATNLRLRLSADGGGYV